jgi:hypothetical protein
MLADVAVGNTRNQVRFTQPLIKHYEHPGVARCGYARFGDQQRRFGGLTAALRNVRKYPRGGGLMAIKVRLKLKMLFNGAENVACATCLQ